MVVKGQLPMDGQKGVLSTKEGIVSEEIKIQSQGIALNTIKPFKVVIDAANSMGSIDMSELFNLLPCNLIKENFNLDGNFPAHVADPLDPKNLAFCEEAVKANNADLGISIDGDGDRYFFVDEKGIGIPQPIIRGIMAQMALRENPGATVAYDIRPGKITKDMIEAVGGKSIITKVGHSLIKEQMLLNNAVFGGESSGHYFYKLPYGTFESPVSLVLRFLLYLSEQGKPLSEIVAPYKKYFHTGEINFEIEDKLGAMKMIEEHFKDGKIINLDGLTIEFPDFWFNMRPSNTEPLLRFALESVSKEVMEQKKQEVIQLIEEYKNKK
jgi:phosphomannomutase